MKIFVSHSGRQKPLVRELRRLLPQPVDLWIDEQVRVGSDIDVALREAIEKDCDFAVLLLDVAAANSPWVRKEIEWALARERELGRPFLLPIVVDEEALQILGDPRLSSRRHLTCRSFEEEDVAALARNLSSELFAWLGREFDRSKHSKEASPLGMLRQAEMMTQELAEVIKEIVYPHRLETPLPLKGLIEKLNIKRPDQPLKLSDIRDVLDVLQRQNLLGGIVYDEDVIYLARESYFYKSKLRLQMKRQVARCAISFLRPGQTVALDGGTTVLELTQQLAAGLKNRSLDHMRVVTTFLPAAYTLLSKLGELGEGDTSSLCTVYVAGGRARPVSLTLISAGDLVQDLKDKTGNRPALDEGAGLRGLLEALGGVDVAFMGTNGLYREKGFAVAHQHEVFAKRLMTEHARQRVILADASKFKVQQREPFALFDQGLDVITAADPEHEDAIQSFQQIIASTSSRLILA